MDPTTERVLCIWVIYENPLDFPGSFVLRPQWVCRDSTIEIAEQPTAVERTLDDARRRVPPGLYRQPRHPEDDPTIVETWF